MEQQPRLTPEMSSRRVIVLDFVTAYIRTHSGVSPSLGEIRAACRLNSREAAREIVSALVEERRLGRVPGKARGLYLLSDLEEAVRRLREAGYVVDDDVFVIGRRPMPALTFSTLPMLPDAAQIAAGDDGSGGDGAGADGG